MIVMILAINVQCIYDGDKDDDNSIKGSSDSHIYMCISVISEVKYQCAPVCNTEFALHCLL